MQEKSTGHVLHLAVTTLEESHGVAEEGARGAGPRLDHSCVHVEASSQCNTKK